MARALESRSANVSRMGKVYVYAEDRMSIRALQGVNLKVDEKQGQKCRKEHFYIAC